MSSLQLGNTFAGTYTVDQKSARSLRAIDNVAAMEYLAESIVEEIESKLVFVTSHKFQPIGVTTVAIISESHIAIHTFPENSLFTVDIFCCNRHRQLARTDGCIRKLLQIAHGSYILSERF